MAKGTISLTLAEWLLVILIVVSLVFEGVLHRIEHWINHKHQHLQTVMRLMYRELMVLGFVSFFFILYQFIAKPGGDVILTFEFAHVFIFLLAIFYVGVVMSTIFTSLRLSARWKEMEQLDLVKYLHLKEEYTRLRMHMHRHHGSLWRKFRWWFPNFRKLWHYRDLHEVMTFHDIRFQFIFYRNLPEHFRFSSFLRKIKSLTFVNLVEAHWTIFAIFLGLLLIDLLRRKLDPRDDVLGGDIVDQAVMIAAAVMLVIAVQLLTYKIRRIHWKLTKHPRVYYEGVEPADVAEELAAAETRRQAERANRRRSRSGNPSDAQDPGAVADDEDTDASAGPHDSAENELTLPMNATPLHNTLVSRGVPDPEKASSLATTTVHDPLKSADGFSRWKPEAAPSSSSSIQGKATMLTDSRISSSTRNSIDRTVPSQQRSSLEYLNGRRSTDLAPSDRAEGSSGKLPDTRRVRSSLEDFPAAVPALAEMGVSEEYHETASRHSLELAKRHVVAAQRSQGPRQTSSVAAAAVAAARKRSIEYQTGRRSMEADPERRSIGSPRIVSGLSSEGDTRNSLGDMVRGSLDSGGRRGRRTSIEMVAALPEEELMERHGRRSVRRGDDEDLEAGMSDLNRDESEARQGRGIRFAEQGKDMSSASKASAGASGALSAMNSFIRSKSLGLMNATIVKNLEQQQKAQNTEPAPYSKFVLMLFPRLGRVASPVEKLFWFGSHRFFLWCVEAILYFATVLLAAASAVFALFLLERKTTGKSITAVQVISFSLPPLALLFVLIRIAGIMKNYIFILHNASLVPEALAIEAIHTIASKDKSRIRDDLSDVSGSDSEGDDGGAALERRKTLGRWFRSEAEMGNVPGIDAGLARSSNGGSESASQRRGRKRKIALRMRSRRDNSQDLPMPGIPDRATTAEYL